MEESTLNGETNMVFDVLLSKGIRPILTPANYDSKNWVHLDMMWPRSLTAWIHLLHSLKTPVFSEKEREFTVDIPSPPYIPNTIPHPWFHRTEAAKQLEAFFLKNQRIRFQLRRIVNAYLYKKMRRRIVGEKDVGTLESIPLRDLVFVCDVPSRSVYHFHVNTIHRHIVGNLRYQSLAISSPKAPKNPYTNLPWSTGQLLVIFDQIHRVLWNTKCAFLDPAAQAFYRSGLCLVRFRTLFGDQLDRDCARRFFHDSTSEYWDIIYGETITELFQLVHVQAPIVLRSLLLDQSLPIQVLTIWNDLVWGFWCYENLGRMVLPGVCSIQDMLRKCQEEVDATMKFIRNRRAAKKPPPS
jgi:hypothetical protein